MDCFLKMQVESQNGGQWCRSLTGKASPKHRATQTTIRQQDMLPSPRSCYQHCFSLQMHLLRMSLILYIKKIVPLSISRLQLLMQFRMGTLALPVEQGRLAGSVNPRHLRRYVLREIRATADKRLFFTGCACCGHTCRQDWSLYQEGDGAMQ